MRNDRLAYFPKMEITIARNEQGHFLMSGTMEGTFHAEHYDTMAEVLKNWIHAQNKIVGQWKRQQTEK